MKNTLDENPAQNSSEDVLVERGLSSDSLHLGDDQNNGHRKGFFAKGVGAIREWKNLQKQIQANSAKVTKNEREVQEGINTYRLSLTEVSFKPVKVDQDIWSSYRKVIAENPALQKRTLRVPLYLKSRKRLREYYKAWSDLLAEQQNLISLLEKAPKTLDFYNRIHMARIQKREQESRDSELADRNAKAKEAVENALILIGQTNEFGHTAPLNSTILRLEDAQSYWRQRLNEVARLETSTTMDPEEMVMVFRNLEETIRELPSMAEQVKEIEVLFIRLMTLHEELSSFGKNVIPPEDLSRMLIMVQDEIPRLWATGSWEKLRKCISDVKGFIKHYDLPIRTELSTAERKKPTAAGMTKAILTGSNSLPFSEAIHLIRSMVSAVDARDPFMRGHSDTVARLSRQMAARMNWNSEDIESLEVAALLHDVGKIMVPESVLTKKDMLTPEEWKSIQTHPIHGARIVKPLTSLAKIIPWIYHHQERWDGSGYPDGLAKTNIPLPARLLAISEAFTAMTTDMPNRKALSVDEALSEVTKGAGTQFDPEVAEALSDTIQGTASEISINQAAG